MVDLPLFPLPETVVFPGMTIPLYVFEERYKRLVRICKESEDPRFVIALVRPPGQVSDGSPPAHYPVGTFMKILSIEENPDGTFFLLAHGRERCRIEVCRGEEIPDLDGHRRPLYHIADCPEPIGRDDPNQERVAAWDALETFRVYAERFFPSHAKRQIEDALPEDLLYQASFICANVRLPAESRQVLLEAETLGRRFHLVRQLMLERLQPGRSSRPS